MARKKQLKNLDDGSVHAVEVEARDGEYRISSADPGWTAGASRSRGSGVWSILTGDGRSFEVLVSSEDGALRATVGHRSFRFAVEGGGAQARRGASRASGRQEIRAPMPGKVVEVLVAQGNSVRAGQPLVLFEAMKMQNELRSPHDGVVLEVVVSGGQPVEAREALVAIYVQNIG